MDGLLNWFLKQYDRGDHELFLKARLMVLVSGLIMLATVFTIAHSAWLGQVGEPLAVQGVAMLLMIGAVVLLARGRYVLATHTLFTSGFSSLWLVFFLDPASQVLAKVDSIVLVIGLMSATAFFKTHRPIALYFGVNFLVFIGAMLDLNARALLPPGQLLEYFFDNAIAMAFVFFIAVNASAIQRQVLARLRAELAERRRTEGALSDSERRLSDHILNTPVGAIFWDKDFRVTGWNPSAERIFGYTEVEALGRHAVELILTEDIQEDVAGLFQNLLAGRGGGRSVNENKTKSGKIILCDWYNSVLTDRDGNVVGAASLVNDITEKTRMQEMMIQSEKMMSVGGLAAGMAHEINNPLAGILQNAQLLAQRLATQVPANERAAAALGVSMDAVRDYAAQRGILGQVENIGKAARHATTIVESMLSFSRKSRHVRERVGLQELVDQTLSLASHDHDLKKKYPFGRIDLVCDLAPDLPAVFCEKVKIQQVLLNLINNAVDAVNLKEYGDGSPRINLRVKTDLDSICLEVEDNGPGMAPEICQHVFEPFFTTKAHKGTGLGLSISHHIIVEEHGGKMKAVSEPGAGACFTVWLPLRSDQGLSGADRVVHE